jgi:hypothetical protein
MQANKFKPLKRCSCGACRRYFKHKQSAYRVSRRQFRHRGNNELKDALGDQIIDEPLITRLDDLVLGFVSSDYTD